MIGMKHLNPICDGCLTAGEDEGANTIEEAEMLMKLLGADLADHLCDQVETDGEIRCGCGCQRR